MDDKCKALAYLYVKSRNLSEKTPEELIEIYEDAYKKICDRDKEIREEWCKAHPRKSLI